MYGSTATKSSPYSLVLLFAASMWVPRCSGNCPLAGGLYEHLWGATKRVGFSWSHRCESSMSDLKCIGLCTTSRGSRNNPICSAGGDREHLRAAVRQGLVAAVRGVAHTLRPPVLYGAAAPAGGGAQRAARARARLQQLRHGCLLAPKTALQRAHMLVHTLQKQACVGSAQHVMKKRLRMWFSWQDTPRIPRALCK